MPGDASSDPSTLQLKPTHTGSPACFYICQGITNHIKIVIGDNGDDAYDSSVTLMTHLESNNKLTTRTMQSKH